MELTMLIRPEMRMARLIHENFINFYKLIFAEVEETANALLGFSAIHHPFFNAVLSTHLRSDDLNVFIDSIIKKYNLKTAQPFFWWITQLSEPPEIQSILMSKGFKKQDEYAAMYFDLEKLEANDLIHDPNLKIKEVETLQELGYWLEPVKLCFNFSAPVANQYFEVFKTHLFQKTYFKHYLIYHDNELIGSASAFFDKKSVGFYNLSILPAFRKEAVFVAIQKYRLEDAKQNGHSLVVLQASRWITQVNLKIGFTKNGYYLPYKLHLLPGS